MDCEMVGVGFQGKDHMLARISIVNQQGDIIMDKYVKPSESVSIMIHEKSTNQLIECGVFRSTELFTFYS